MRPCYVEYYSFWGKKTGYAASDGPTDGQTDRQTDAHRYARTHLTNSLETGTADATTATAKRPLFDNAMITSAISKLISWTNATIKIVYF